MWKWIIFASILPFVISFIAVRSLTGGFEKEVRVPESKPMSTPVRKVDSTQPTFLDEKKFIGDVKAQKQKYDDSLPKPEPESPSLTTEPKTPQPPSPVRSEPNQSQERPTTPTPESDPLRSFTSPDIGTQNTTDELFGNQ